MLPLSGHGGHGRTSCWLDLVANDPELSKRTASVGQSDRVGPNSLANLPIVAVLPISGVRRSRK
jgi:hypothetical protein